MGMLRDTTLPLANQLRDVWVDLIVARLESEAKGKRAWVSHGHNHMGMG